MTETGKPFVCARDGCEMAFTNEDHLNVHKKKHDMALHLGIDSQNNTVADQTPTPTRFIRNCEEVGLFQDLQNVNPFDETFRKAAELVKTGSLHIPPDANLDDTLHTPHIFPHIEEENNANNFSRNNSNEPEFVVTTINADDLLKLNTGTSDLNKTEKSNSDMALSSVGEDSDEDELILVQDCSTCTPSPNKDDLTIDKCLPTPDSMSSSTDSVCGLNKIQISMKSNYFKSACAKREDETIKAKIKEALRHRLKTENESEDHSKIESVNVNCNETNESIDRKCWQKNNRESTIVSSSPPPPLSPLPVPAQPPLLPSLQKTKRQIQLERQREVNRAAQVRSREKKKCRINQMEKEIELLRDEKKELWLENQNLKNEIVWLKTMLLYHKDCPVARDPQITDEINRLVKTSQEELQKKTEKTSSSAPKRMIPIRPNSSTTSGSVVTLAPIPNSVLVPVPSLPDPPALQAKPTASVTSPNVSMLMPSSAVPVSNFIIGVPLNVSVISSSNGSDVLKRQSRIVRVKNKVRKNVARTKSNNAIEKPLVKSSSSKYFAFSGDSTMMLSEVQTPAKLFKDN